MPPDEGAAPLRRRKKQIVSPWRGWGCGGTLKDPPCQQSLESLPRPQRKLLRPGRVRRTLTRAVLNHAALRPPERGVATPPERHVRCVRRAPPVAHSGGLLGEEVWAFLQRELSMCAEQPHAPEPSEVHFLNNSLLLSFLILKNSEHALFFLALVIK